MEPSPPPAAPARAPAFCGVAFAAALLRCLPAASAAAAGLPAAASPASASAAPRSSAGGAAMGEALMSCGSAEAAPKVPGD
eukprot:scaffold38069_cov45-Phaeocystis_antarctica.AAC.2